VLRKKIAAGRVAVRPSLDLLSKKFAAGRSSGPTPLEIIGNLFLPQAVTTHILKNVLWKKMFSLKKMFLEKNVP
jgi:hypothetical protein